MGTEYLCAQREEGELVWHPADPLTIAAVMLDLASRRPGDPQPESCCLLCGSTDGEWRLAARIERVEGLEPRVGGFALVFHCRDHPAMDLPLSAHGGDVLLVLRNLNGFNETWQFVQGTLAPKESTGDGSHA